ncbi:uncharacterized protein IUM83_04599 [Phytophthora cinnamomi]|uniref:uncharacterized protein n=1 Tax=Phytophthora cinnamomi TaxID=4785 RepID=UPI00355AC1BF|nr:hypothetical protein IUM83_04599 [Phytophthora cinnamomi]
MGDSAAALWESELLRARQWLAARRRDEQQERERLFRRVRAHIGFKEHQRSLQSDAAASEEEDDDLALDFLGDVDASDMKQLLQAEAAKAAGPVPPPAPLQPLAMPSNLASPTLKPKAKAVPMSQLDPKTVQPAATTATTASATLGTDESVQELMQDLNLDMTHLQTSSDAEESKTEESTPPHLSKDFGGSGKVGSESSQGAKAAAGSTQSKFMQHVSLKSPQDPHEKKAAVPTATKPDEVAAEMLSWVTGYRDPEVIRRKENMRRRRKHTHRYGMSSEEEQRQALRRVKKITRDSNSDSDSESEDDFSSDYSPAEEEEVPEQDEPEVVDLLSDDYLDSDEDKKPVKRKRKRLRQGESTQKKKKLRSRKPAVTRKLTQQDNTDKAPLQTEKTPEVQAPVGTAASKANHAVATTKSASIEGSDEEDARGNSTQPIEVLSSDDETGDSDKSSASTTVKGTKKTDESDATKGSTILRLKIPKDFLSSESFQEVSQNAQQSRTGHKDLDNTPSQPSNRADKDVVMADAPSAPMKSTVDGQTEGDGSRSGREKTTQQFVDANGDDADLSDTGTVDLEGEELLVGNEEINPGEQVSSTEVAADKGARVKKDTAENMNDVLKIINTKTNAEDGDMDDEDVSEAETEVLEGDESDTDDLGLNYSDDSDADDKPAANKKNGAGDNTKSSSDEKDQTAADKNNGTGGKTKSSRDKKDETASAQKAPETGNGGDSEKPPSDKSGEKAVDSSTAGVQQFFDFTPLKLKPKAKTTTTTAPKPLPVHDYAETHLQKERDNARKAVVETKKTPSPEKPSIGSNGLRPSKKPIATSTVMKGKFTVTRRSTKMLDPEDTPGAKRSQKSRYTMVPTNKSNASNATKDLDDVPLALLAREMSKTVYVTGVNPTVCAEQIEEDFARFGVAVDQDTGFPAINVFPSQRTHVGRGDACVTFETEEGAQEAVEELNSKNVKNSMIRVRRMDVRTQRILTVQFETVRDTWKCAGTQCRADVSVWNPKCDKCGQKRVFGPSNIKIGAESWLCSICFTANDSFATKCHGCMESLPDVNRSSFYVS